MRIGILHCGSVLKQFQPQYSDYPDMLQLWLKALQPDLNFNIYAVHKGIYPESIDKCDAYITTGSHHSVYDPLHWIADFQSYLLALHQRQKPLIGICFGHQLVAQALGGKTEKAKAGWGVGVKVAKLYKKQQWMQPPLDEVNLLVSHQDQVTVLPAKAELLAGYEHCQNAIFTIGDHILCFQGHPEFTKPYAEALMHHRADILGKAILKTGIESLKLLTHEKEMAQWVIRFINREGV